MFGSLGNISSLLRQAQSVRKQIAELQEDLAKRRYEADSGGGAVVATVDGRGELVRIQIRLESANLDDREILEDLLVAAVNAASAKAKQAVQEEMSKITGGLDLSGLEGLLGGK